MRFTTLGAFAILAGLTGSAFAGVTLPPASSTAGYICRLLINESPFPGERGYYSEADSKAAMEQVLHVINNRLHHVPAPYRQSDIAGVTADDIVDVITAGGIKGQVDGFYRDKNGRPAMVSRVSKRLDHLLRVAGEGEPGKFARLLEYAATISSNYVAGVLERPDRYEDVYVVQKTRATGSCFSWMTDDMQFHPGGNYLRIPDNRQGSLGGNRFFTLRKEPK